MSQNDATHKVGVRILYKHRAIIISGRDEPKRYLIVSDLHLGFEEKFRGAGISLESKIDKLLNELTELIERERITDLLINGDVKSGTDHITKSEWDNVPRFFDKMSESCAVSVIPGNHDGGLQHILPQDVTLLDSNGVMIFNTLIFHGHTRPLPKFRDCDQLIMGHLHPIFQRRGSPLSGQPVWVFLKIDKRFIFKDSVADASSLGDLPQKQEEDEIFDKRKDFRITLMPSFNLDLVVAGYAVDAARQERKIAPILRDIKGNVSEGMVITLEGDLIGDSSLLPSIL